MYVCMYVCTLQYCDDEMAFCLLLAATTFHIKPKRLSLYNSAHFVLYNDSSSIVFEL